MSIATGSNANSTLGTACVISEDGLVAAFAERVDGTDAFSNYIVRIYRKVANVWGVFGTPISGFQTTNFITNGELASPSDPSSIYQFIDLSANGNTIIIGDYFVNIPFPATFAQGQVRIYQYDSGTDSWIGKGSNFAIDAIDPYILFGQTVSISGDSTHIAIGSIDSASNYFVDIYGFDVMNDVWVSINLFPVDSVSTIAPVYFCNIAFNFDGTTFGIGNPFFNYVRIYRKANSLDFSMGAYSLIKTILSTDLQVMINMPDGFGQSIDFDKTGDRIVIGAPLSGIGNPPGGVQVFQYNGSDFLNLGGSIAAPLGVNDQYFGTIVSMSSDGDKIAVTQRVIAPQNQGVHKIYSFNGISWGQIFTSSTQPQRYPTFARISGSGNKLLLGSSTAGGPDPGNAGGFGTLTLLNNNATVEVYDNQYSQEISNTFQSTHNAITDLGLSGIDNDPNGLAVSLFNVDNGSGSFVAFASLPANPFFGVPMDPRTSFVKRIITNIGSYPVYLNSNGLFLLEADNNAMPPGTDPFFRYNGTNGTTQSSTPATVSFSLSIGTLMISPVSPTTVVVTKNANSVLAGISITNGSGTLNVAGGIRPFVFTTTPPSSVRGSFGIMNPTPTSYDYTYVPSNFATVGNNFIDMFTFQVDDSQPVSDSVMITVDTTIRPELIFNTPAQPSITRQVGQSPVTTNLSGIFSSTGGLAPKTFTVIGGTVAGSQSSKLGTYGTMTISNTTTGAYIYSPTNVPTTAGAYSDSFTIRVTDTSNDFKEIPFNVTITVFQSATTFSLIPIATQGSVVKAAGGTNVVTLGLAGNILVTPGTGTIASYDLVNGTPAGNDRFIITPNGQLTVNAVTGSYVYTVNFGAIGNVIALYSDTFTLSATSTNGNVATTPYVVTFEIRPQMLLGQLSPSAGVINRNTKNQPGAISISGLSGTIVPVVTNAVGALAFSIDGGMLPPGSFVTVASGTLGNLFVNIVTGEYNFDADSLNLPAVPGVYLNQFTIRVKDSKTPVPNEQTLIYNIGATIFDTPIGLLPVFRDSTTREIAGYWNFIVHDATGTSNITSSGNIIVPNTELLVIGQTETNSDSFRNPDGLIRQLLGSSAYDRSNPTDVVVNVKNNTSDVLDANNINGIQTRSIQLSRVQNSSLQIFVTELSDVLSSQHSRFLLNRYRSNIGESVVILYANDAVSPLPNGTATAILNQISQLISLGTRTIIGVMMAATLNPAISAEKTALQNAQAGFLNQIAAVAGNANVTILSVIVRYDSTNKFYQNVAGKGSSPSTQPEIGFTVTGYSSFNLFGALSQISIIPQDSTNPNFRIVIKTVNASTKEAIGDVIYGTIPTGTRSFVSSRLFTDNTRSIVAASAIVDILGVNIAAGQIPSITVRQGTTGKNVDQLKPGDVLYASTYAFTRPTTARLLISVVSGYKSPNLAGTQLFLQIDDGMRFPNNPVFPVTVVAIVNRFNSNTLALANPAGTFVEAGFDYEVDVKDLEAPGAIGSAGLELYTQFPRLGFVTLYFGSTLDGKPIYNAYGRGAVKSITRS